MKEASVNPLCRQYRTPSPVITHKHLKLQQTAARLAKIHQTDAAKIVPKIEVLVNQSPKANQTYHSIIEDFSEVPSTIDSIRVFRTHIKNDGDKILRPDVHLEYGVYETAELIKLAGVEKTVYPGESVEFDLKINKNKITSKGQIALILDYGHNSKLEGSVIEVDP